MPPSNYYRDRWPHPTPGNAQNPPMWIQTQVHPRQPPHRLGSQRMDDHTTNSQVTPSDVRLRMGRYDPHGAEAEYGPYYSEEQVSYLVTVPGFQGHPGSAGRPNDEHQPRRDAAVVGRWIRPGASDDRVTAQLTGRIEMLQQRIGAVERREQEQRASWDQRESQQSLPPAHQGVRWAYSAENRPGFWETGYGPQQTQRQPERLPVPPRVSSSSGFQPVASSSLIRPNIPPPVAVPSPESDMPPPPVTGHKVYILDCKSCGTFLSNRGMKARFNFLLLKANSLELTFAYPQAVLLLRPNIALFSTDAMPVNCSPQPVASRPASDDIFEGHPQDITDLVQNAQASSSTEQRPEQVLYASYFLPPKGAATSVHPEKVTPERSADIAGAHPSSNQPLPRTCECLTQTLSCHGCGAGIGYMIVTPCVRCTAQQSVGGRPGQPQRTANGHRFVFHHAEIVARERLYVPGQPGVHRYPWGIPPTTSTQHSPTPVQLSDSRSRVPSTDSEPKSPSIPVFQPHRDGNFVPILSQVPARAPTRRIQNPGLKAGDVVFWHHLGRTGELGGVSLGDVSYTRDFVER